MNANIMKTVILSIFLVSLFLFRPASAQTFTNTCTAQLNTLKGVLIFNPAPDESYGGTRVLYHWYAVIGTDFYIRTDHWDGDALLVEGPLFLGPYDLVLPDSQGVPPSAVPLCFNFTARILSLTKNGAGEYTLVFAGSPGQNYQVQAATNLTAPVFWTALTNNADGTTNFTADAGGRWSHTDLSTSNFTARFYRTVQP